MKNVVVFATIFLFSIACIFPVLTDASPGTSDLKNLRPKMGVLKIPFVRNEAPDGNVPFMFQTATPGTKVYVGDATLTYTFVSREGHGGWAIGEKILGTKETKVEGLSISPTKVSMFKGSDPKNWRVATATYNELTFGEICDGVRLNVKAHGNNVEKIFVIESGGDPEKIALQVEGAKSLRINNDGELEIETGVGIFKMTAPLAYQEIEGKRVKVAANYELRASQFQETDGRHIYGFKVGDYDKTKPLVIDPLPRPQATYLGGISEDRASFLAIDQNDNVFVVGYTKSLDFYTGEVGPFQPGPNGNMDVFVAKLSNDLKDLQAIAFLGGNNDDYGTAIAIDSEGNVLITGYTLSSTFPTTPFDSASFPPYDSSHNGGADAFVAKLDGNLSSLIASTFLGGNNSDYSFSIAIDPDGKIYITGWTLSPTGPSGFPVTPLAYDSPSHGSEDIFVSKFDPNLQSLLASSRFGGTNSDYAYSLTINQDNGEVYLAGATASIDFPTTFSAYATSSTGNLDVLVSRLDGTLSTLLSSTYIGGSEHDVARGIALSPTGDVFITGWTASGTYPGAYPVTAGAYSQAHGGNVDVFVTKFNTGLSTLLASTFLGGTAADQGNGIILDAAGNVYVTGWTSSNDFPASEGAFDSTRNGNQDVFIAHLNSELNALLASTYIGGVSHDAVNSIALDSTGMVFVAGYTNSPDLIPIQFDGGFDDVYADSWDAFVYRQRPDLSRIYLLSVLLPGDGNGTVVSAPNGIKCGKCPLWDNGCHQDEYDDCEEEFNREITVTLTAEPSVDSTFQEWTGGCDGTGTQPDTCTVTVVGLKSIGAFFRLKTFNIAATTDTGGAIYPSGTTVVTYGSSIELSVVPNSGYYVSDVIVDGVSKGRITSFRFENVTSDHTIRAVFRPNPVILADISPDLTTPPGTISPSGSVKVSYGGSQSFIISSAPAYYLSDLVVDGVSQKDPLTGEVPTTYTFTDVVVDHAITAFFTALPVIEASSTSGGTILPSGTVIASYKGGMTFYITPNSGYYLADLIVDGVSVGRPTSYTFTNIVIDHKISAVFRPNPVIQTSADTGGTISPSGTVTVQFGGNQTFSISPNDGYYLADVIVDGNSVDPPPPKYGTYTYVFSNVESDRTIRAVFRPNPVIQTSADTGGTISPSGSVMVQYGATQSFSITPNEGYYLADVIVDGSSVDPPPPKYGTYTYTFTNVVIGRTIRAVFRANPTIQALADTGGTINPSGTVSVRYGASQSFSVYPATGYYMADVIVDGNSVYPPPPLYGVYNYTFANVTSNHTIRGVFKPNPVISASAGTGGTIEPYGDIDVPYGSTLVFSIIPDTGSFVQDVVVDGVSIGPFASYTFEDITSNHTITASFAQVTPQGPFTIVATSGPGGRIKPFGLIKVKPLKKKAFSIKANPGYHIEDVKVDGYSKGRLSRYVFDYVSASHTIEATFNTKKTLNVVLVGAGKGMVVSKPAGISCGKDCSQEYDTGDLVLLIPRPAADSVFAGWSGGGCKGTDTCTVTMDDDVTVIATFTLK